MEFLINKFRSAIGRRLADKGIYDARIAVLVFVAIISMSVFWNGAKIVQQNYELSLKVAEIEQENTIFELENRNKELQNDYLATDEFAEITARRVFGRAAPGEKVYIVPKEVALKSLSTPIEEIYPEEIQTNKPQYQQNIESWLNIYFGN
ncbi:MAG: cell division protein FtsB [Candidatus Saccharimonadales bacterium]|jgi:cell division protein FtsB